jgi:uncharacterized membrane protein
MKSIITVFYAGLAIVLVGAIGISRVAQAQVMGDVIEGRVQVAGKQVPLPPGIFTVISVETGPARAPEGETEIERLDLGPVQTVVLASAAEGRVSSVVEISANLIPHHDGWGTTADCTRTDLYAAIVNYKSGWDVSCLYLKPMAMTDEAERPGGLALVAFGVVQQAEITDFWITAGLRVANRQDVLDVRYHLDPATFGVPGTAATDSAWAPAVIEQSPARLAVIKDIAAWASLTSVSLDQGLRGRLTGDAQSIAISGAAVTDAVGSEAGGAAKAARATELLALREQNAMSEPEYQRQMAMVTSGAAAAAAAGGWTYAQVAGWKAATYRVMVTTVNVGIDYVFIGRPFAAGVLVILQVVVNTTKFFFHEMMWQELFGISPLQRENPNVIELGRRVVAASAQ